MFFGNPLKGSKRISDYGIKVKSTIFLAMRVSGGGCRSTIFNSLDQPVYDNF